MVVRNKISLRELYRRKGIEKKLKAKIERDLRLEKYYLWFSSGLGAKEDQSQFTSLELYEWGKARGMANNQIRPMINSLLKHFGYERVPNPNSVDGRYYKGNNSFMLYRKTQPKEGEAITQPSIVG